MAHRILTRPCVATASYHVLRPTPARAAVRGEPLRVSRLIAPGLHGAGQEQPCRAGSACQRHRPPTSRCRRLLILIVLVLVFICGGNHGRGRRRGRRAAHHHVQDIFFRHQHLPRGLAQGGRPSPLFASARRLLLPATRRRRPSFLFFCLFSCPSFHRMAHPPTRTPTPTRRLLLPAT